MRDLGLPFAFYNPLTDTRLNPPTELSMLADPRIPLGLAPLISKAKALISGLDLEQIKMVAHEINQLCDQGALQQITQPAQTTERAPHAGDDADTLRNMLARCNGAVPPTEWPRYMGVLALSFAGQIHCTLWPTDDYLKISHPTKSMLEPVPEETRLQRMATMVARATAYGEAFRDVLAADVTLREANRKNGPKAHEKKQKIADQFIAWATQLPKPNQFTTTIDAVRWFIDNKLSLDEKKLAASYTFPRTLSEKLSAYLAGHGLPHPFRES